jgi:hypothetical protein
LVACTEDFLDTSVVRAAMGSPALLESGVFMREEGCEIAGEIEAMVRRGFLALRHLMKEISRSRMLLNRAELLRGEVRNSVFDDSDGKSETFRIGLKGRLMIHGEKTATRRDN